MKYREYTEEERKDSKGWCEPITFKELCDMFGYDENGNPLPEEERDKKIREIIPTTKSAHGEDNDGFRALDRLSVAPPPKEA